MTGQPETIGPHDSMVPANGHSGNSHAATIARSEPASESVTMEWVATLSILKDQVVLLQLGLVYVIPLVVLALILTPIIRPSDLEEWGFLAQIVLIAAAVYLGLLLISILLVYGGRYEYEFRLNEEGIGGRPHGRTAKKNRAINLLLLFAGGPTAAGSGMLAQARQVEYVAWKDIDTVIVDTRHKTLTLSKDKRPLMVVPCDEEHFATVTQFAENAAARTRSRRKRKRA